MDRRTLLSGSIRLLIHSVDRLADALQHQIELIVGGVEIVEDRLQGGIGIDVVPDAEQQPMSDVDDDRDLVQVVTDHGWFHGSPPVGWRAWYP